MDLPEGTTQSFIIRIWLEETEAEARQTLWRGSITHVSSGKRHHFQKLEAIASFIAPYLSEMGVKLTTRWRIQRRLHHLH